MELSKDEIISLAREAGFETKVLNSIDGEEVLCFDPLITDMLKDFAALVAAHEREACAKVCDELQKQAELVAKCFDATAEECATAIRARGK